MLKSLSGALAVAILVLPSVSRAETGDDVHGFELGFRTGVQLPSGKFGDGAQLGDVVSGGLPLWFDVGHRVSRNFYYGFALSYAPSLGTPDIPSCNDPFTCSASNMRVGLNLQVHPTVSMEEIDPWFGFGVMYDVLNLSQSGTDPFFGPHEIRTPPREWSSRTFSSVPTIS